MFRLFLAFALSLAAGLAWPQDAEYVGASKAELERVRQRIESLSETLERNKSRQGELERDLEASEQDVAAVLQRLRQLRAEVDLQNKSLRATQAEQARVEGLQARHKQVLGQQVRAAYIIGKQGQTKLLLNQQDAQRLGRVMVYYEYLNRARGGHIRAIQQQLAEIRKLAQRQSQEAEALAALRQRQEQALAALKTSRAQRTAALRQLKRRIAGEAGQLALLQKTEKDLQAVLSSLRDALSDIPLDLGRDKPFGALKGRLQWPARGKLLARFGQPKAGGKLRWNGWWIDVPEGAPVKAVARGRVAHVGWMHRYGLIVIVEHEGGYFSLYGHNQSAAKSAGDWVAAGEAIASAGSTGGHERPGVYFEVRKGTQPLDPRMWLGK